MKLAPARTARFVLANDPAVVAAANQDERQRALDTIWNGFSIRQRHTRRLLERRRFRSNSVWPVPRNRSAATPNRSTPTMVWPVLA